MPTLGEDLLLAASQAVHHDFSREAKFAHFAFRINDPAALSFFCKKLCKGA